MSRTGSEFFVDALETYGVSHLFGNPGTTELPLMDALSSSDIEYVLGLHEDVAVGMASGYAKVRQWHAWEDPSINPLGVVNLHVAPGLAHGLGNVFDSGLLGTGTPLLVTAGWHSTGHQHREPNLYGDLVDMADQFTKWSAEVKDPESFPNMLRRAVRTALTPPTAPVFLALPFDVMTDTVEAPPDRLGSIPQLGDGDREQIERAAEAIVDAAEPVLVVGDRLARAGPGPVADAIRIAEATGSRVHGEFRSSEPAFPTDHPQWAGGLPNDRERSSALLGGDVVTFVGTISNVPTLEQNRPIVDFADSTCIHVSDFDREIGKNYVSDIGILGDMGPVMAAIADLVDGQVSDAERERRLAAADAVVDAGSDRDDRRNDRAHPSLPTAGQLAEAVVTAAPDARIVAEATTSVGALRDRGAFEPGDFYNYRGGGLGYGLSASVGMAVAEAQHDRSRPVVGFIGDGSFLYYPQAIYSAVRAGVDVTVVVANNRNYQVLKDKMPGLTGRDAADHEYLGMELSPPIDLPTMARAQGATARRVEDAGAIAPAIDEAVADSGTTVIDVHIQE